MAIRGKWLEVNELALVELGVWPLSGQIICQGLSEILSLHVTAIRQNAKQFATTGLYPLGKVHALSWSIGATDRRPTLPGETPVSTKDG